MEGTKRREMIVEQLKKAKKPISASIFAEQFGVSRQIIVGDIALLRAAGVKVIATARGYRLELSQPAGLTGKIAVQHRPEQTQEELLLFVKHGAEVLDVVIEHDIYGELTGSLHIKTQQDVADFIKRYEKSKVRLLSDLTQGIHLHTLRYDKNETLQAIKQDLDKRGFLYHD